MMQQNTSVKELIAPTVEPISVTEVKAFLKLDHDADDSLITDLIIAARLYCEQVTGRSFIMRQYQYMLDQWPNEKLQILSLPKPPLLDVVSIHYYDEKEVRQLYPAEYYYSDAVSTPGRLVLKSNVTPPITYRKAAAIEITYHAGYGHVATDVPAPLRQAILRLTAYLYEHRDMHDRMQDAMQMSGVMMLLSPYKMVGLS